MEYENFTKRAVLVFLSQKHVNIFKNILGKKLSDHIGTDTSVREINIPF